MFERVFYGNTLQEWTISLAIIVGAFILNKLISLLNKHIIQRIMSKTKNRFDDLLFQKLEAPVLLGIILVAIWVAAARLFLPEKVHEIISKSYELLTVINVTWFFSRFALAMLEEYGKHKTEIDEKTKKPIDNRFFPLIKRTSLFVIWVIGIVMALNNAGISVSALLTTLGIGGLAFALAAQDTIKNIFGGITIFSDRVFRIGDRIRFDNIDGVVEDIGVRSTKIRTLDRRILTIPNYKVMDASVENVATEPMRKVVLNLALTYDTTPEKLQEAMTMLGDMPNRVKYVNSKDIVVAFTDFATSSLTITFVYFIEKKGDIFKTMTNVNMEILSSFGNAGLRFAFPTQTIHVEK